MCADVPPLRGGNARRCPAPTRRECAPMSRPYAAGMCANVPPLRGGNVRQCPAPTRRECAPMSRPCAAGMCANVPPLRGGNVRQCPAPTRRECAPMSRPYAAGMRTDVPPRRGGATVRIKYGVSLKTAARSKELHGRCAQALTRMTAFQSTLPASRACAGTDAAERPGSRDQSPLDLPAP